MHKSKVVGDLSIVVILKLREGMHFSRSKNARLLNFMSLKEMGGKDSEREIEREREREREREKERGELGI